MFPSPSTPQDIFLTRLFEEPLVPIGTDPTPAENAALAAALLDYSKRAGPNDFSSLTDFLETYPQCPWDASLLTNLGLEYYNTGHYSKALESWSRAWELARTATDQKGRAVADRAVGELAYMYARLGRMAELEALLISVEGRVFSGPATEKITGAREGLSVMQTRPDLAFRCGPLALHRIMFSIKPDAAGAEVIYKSESTTKGCSMPQVEDLSRKLGLNFQMAFRDQGAAFIVPSVVHFKLNHYAAMVREEGGRYLLEDNTFGNSVWVTSEALEAETSGYFLIPPGQLVEGWRTVEAQEGKAVWGKGFTDRNDPRPHGPDDDKVPEDRPGSGPGGGPRGGGPGGSRSEEEEEDECGCNGMAVPSVHLMLVSLNIKDKPVGYSPPVGPAVPFIVRYNQREAFQPATFNYSNLGSKWTFDWLSYIKDNPSSPSADVDYYIMGGGTRTFTGFDSATQTYAFQRYDQTRLTRNSPDSYEMLSRDGTRKVFSQSDGSAGTTRKIFLSRLIDPAGNAVSLAYDANLRLVAITDAIGQITTISYDHPTDIHKITRVTDPFGRFATFDYDASNRLIKITDVMGLSSQFMYDAGDFITTLTTTYGVTSFSKSENGTTRSLETLYPDGNRERVEFAQSRSIGIRASDPPQSVPGGMATGNAFLNGRNTYYWDKLACAYAYGDYTKARIYHWLHANENTTSGILESLKPPLEGRIWYDYAGQPNPMGIGNSKKPSHIGRVLDDGFTQLYTYEYNGFGKVTKMIDPVGRTFSYIYAENDIDLLEIRQTRAGQNQLVSKKTYNNQHLPLTSTDAAGQTTTYTYNARGQILTETNARNETITYTYNNDGYLTSIAGPLPESSTTFTYDTFGRVRTKTNEGGRTLTFDYDLFDHFTRITYPDSTFDRYTYTLLDLTEIQDRAGRKTSFAYNSVRQRTKRTDPLGRVTLYQWCKCGKLKGLTDPMGRTTNWRHDVQGRIKSKEYADGSKVTYRYEQATSRLRQRIDEKLQVTQYNYNPDNSLRHISYSNTTVATPPVAFTFDANYLRLTSMTDGNGTTRFDYIPITPVPSLGAGQLASVNGPLPDDTITFSYDELGRRSSTALNGAASTSTFDAVGRVTSATNALGVFAYTYEGDSLRIASQACPNGQTTEFAYANTPQDPVLRRITNKLGDTPISEFVYDYDVGVGKITSWSQQSGTQAPSVYSLAYDAADQLLSASVSETGNVRKTFGYSYDPAGNRLTEQIDATLRRFSYNALNELVTLDGEVSNSASYQWDAEHRLASIDFGYESIRFTYDGLWRCVGIRHIVRGSEVSNRRLVWCDDELCEERDANGVVSKRFFPQGMKMEVGDAVEAYFYTRDQLGSVRELTDSAGNVRARYDYDPFGQRTRLMGDLDADFGFAGMLRAGKVGLSLARFRTYDSHLGRWLSRDPLKNAEIKEGHNLFSYVHNNPVNLTDPLGLACCEKELNKWAGAEERKYITCGASIAAMILGLGAFFAAGADLKALIGSITVDVGAVAACAIAHSNYREAVADYRSCIMNPCP